MLEIRNNAKLMASLLGSKRADETNDAKNPQPDPARSTAHPRQDAVELTDAAQAFEPKPIDIAQKIARIRDLIARDEYITDDKLDVVAKKLQQELSSRPPRATRIAS